MAVADFLDSKRQEIATRMAELKPLVDEYERLQAAEAALGAVPSASNGSGSKQAAKTRVKPTVSKRGRPKGTGKRATEALELVKATPGITIPQIAEKMGIKQNYLYRVLPQLAKDGKVRKDGVSWFPEVS